MPGRWNGLDFSPPFAGQAYTAYGGYAESMDLVDRIERARHERRPLVMGVLNVTPDSFSDGGRFVDPQTALAHARRMAEEGADIIDVGGESTRPGAEPVDEFEELERVIPVIRAMTAALDVPVSVDTSKPGVMRTAVAAGAAMINDVAGLRTPGAPEAAAELGVPVCVMHMLGEPRTMQKDPRYADVVGDIREFFEQRLAALASAGVERRRVVLDPGFGFGKTLAHNLELLRRLGEFRELGCALMAGISRKSMLGAITGREDPADRTAASVAAALIAVQRGADIIRVHDVAETVDALKVLQASSGRT